MRPGGLRGADAAGLPPAALGRAADALVRGEIDAASGVAAIKAGTGLDERQARAIAAEILPGLLSGGAGPRDAGWFLRGYAAALRDTPPAPEIVWTGPPLPRSWTGITETREVMSEMIRRSERRILLAGYLLTAGAGQVLSALAAAVGRGVAVQIVLDRIAAKMPAIRAAWPRSRAMPEFLTFDPPDPGTGGSLHAKLLVCDGTDVLVTSANLSFRGLRSNIEIGLRLRHPLGERIEQVFGLLEARGLMTRYAAGRDSLGEVRP